MEKQNLEYARSLLLRLEQDAMNIKVQSRKQETQVDLIRKREQLQGLTERLQELDEVSSAFLIAVNCGRRV